jgi:hypothetical protein
MAQEDGARQAEFRDEGHDVVCVIVVTIIVERCA